VNNRAAISVLSQWRRWLKVGSQKVAIFQKTAADLGPNFDK